MDVTDKNEVTSLWLAASSNGVDVMRILIANEANVNARCTPLVISAECGNIKAAQLLIAEGADVNATDKDGDTPLHASLAKNHFEVAKLLLNHEADVNVRNKKNATPLHFLIYNSGDQEMVTLLLANKADMYNGATPLHAVRRGNAHAAKLLLDNKADVNVTKNYGAAPMCIAAQDGRVDLVKLLIDYGAKVNPIDYDGEKPTLTFTFNRYTADIESEVTDWVTPLHAAAQFGQTEVIKLLLENHANVDDRDGFKTTALFTAADTKQQCSGAAGSQRR